jgi:hypothetical protein
MNASRLLLCGVLLTVILATAPAQTNETNTPTDAAPAVPNGPVFMPPDAQNALNALPATDTNAPAAAPSVPSDDAAAQPASSAPATTPGAAPGQPGAKDEIYDIRPPVFFLRSWTWLWITLAAMAALALLIWLALWLRSRSKPTPQSAYEAALARLEKARSLMREEDPIPYAVTVSEAIRTYLSQRFLAPSTRRTTEEFLRQMQTDSTTPLAAYHELLGEFLQSCDLVKFARYQPTLSELEQVQNRAFSFVTATKPEPAGHANGAAA